MFDPFSQVVAVLGTRNVRGTSLKASGEWALTFDGRSRLKFVAVTQGQCWLILSDIEPELLGKGDVVLLSDTRYTVASDPSVEPVDGMELYAGQGQDAVRLGKDCDVAMIGGGSGFADGCAPFVLEALPRFLRIDRASPSAEAIARTLESLRAEVQTADVGSALIAARLAEILVAEAVRAFVTAGPYDSLGWIAALADPRLAKALSLMHHHVTRPLDGANAGSRGRHVTFGLRLAVHATCWSPTDRLPNLLAHGSGSAEASGRFERCSGRRGGWLQVPECLHAGVQTDNGTNPTLKRVMNKDDWCLKVQGLHAPVAWLDGQKTEAN